MNHDVQNRAHSHNVQPLSSFLHGYLLIEPQILQLYHLSSYGSAFFSHSHCRELYILFQPKLIQ